MKSAIVELEANDGEDDNSEENEQSDLKERRHGFDDWFKDHLKTWYAWDELERSEHTNRSQRAQVEVRAVRRDEYGDEAGHHDREVHHVPHAAQIRVFVQCEAQRDYL